jgi:hypothetical protein
VGQPQGKAIDIQDVFVPYPPISWQVVIIAQGRQHRRYPLQIIEDRARMDVASMKDKVDPTENGLQLVGQGYGDSGDMGI